jgi:hypothetical protein
LPISDERSAFSLKAFIAILTLKVSAFKAKLLPLSGGENAYLMSDGSSLFHFKLRFDVGATEPANGIREQHIRRGIE